MQSAGPDRRSTLPGLALCSHFLVTRRNSGELQVKQPRVRCKALRPPFTGKELHFPNHTRVSGRKHSSVPVLLFSKTWPG